MKIHYPFANHEKYPLTQLYGEKFMYAGKIVSHKGVDWGMKKFTALLAPFDGEIVRVEKTRNYGYGRSVYIKSADDKNGFHFEALLAHCELITVNKGYKVKKGQKVAESGRTGFWRGKNGYHIHFGLKFGGKYVNPLPYLKAKDPLQKEIFENDDSKLKTFLGNHTVVKGETLWAIADKFYGNGGHYNEIFVVNQDILKNPNLIYPGQILRIPAIIDKGI